MSKNIKEIGKELLGKSLNSFHRKTGLTQLEKNNEMQDGILDGILSQVDDAYIEKTEQSNVIHLDGSGDGVVVLDGIEGNTMVNCINRIPFNTTPTTTPNTVYCNNDGYIIVNAKEGTYVNAFISKAYCNLKPNTKYTLIIEVVENTLSGGFLVGEEHRSDICTRFNFRLSAKQTGIFKIVSTTKDGEDFTNGQYALRSFAFNTNNLDGEKIKYRIFILEGDYSNVEVNYFEGLQSSFEEKVNGEGKYEIEILMKGSNQFDYTKKPSSVSPNGGGYANYDDQLIYFDRTKDYWFEYETSTQKNIITYFQCYDINKKPIYINYNTNTPNKRIINYSNTEIFHRDTVYVSLKFRDTSATTAEYLNTMITKCHFGIDTPNDRGIKKPKQNKIKLLLNEPLRGTNISKDMLCIKDGKLVVERKYKQLVLNGNNTEKWSLWRDDSKTYRWNNITDIASSRYVGDMMCDKLPRGEFHRWWGLNPTLGIDYGDPNGLTNNSSIYICNPNLDENVTSLRQWLSENNLQVVLPLKEPIYEEVLNEYGVPIILEGYENGTIYIDSTIVPNTTVRYTPKMESFKTLNEVSDNNTMLTNDINDNIIPYMMDVDLMIMEKEMALPSQINNRKMEELDMTSMQKRTQDMLERLIKGKTLTEQECKTRVTTYLNAGKITDEQAEELMLVISEVYA